MMVEDNKSIWDKMNDLDGKNHQEPVEVKKVSGKMTIIPAHKKKKSSKKIVTETIIDNDEKHGFSKPRKKRLTEEERNRIPRPYGHKYSMDDLFIAECFEMKGKRPVNTLRNSTGYARYIEVAEKIAAHVEEKLKGFMKEFKI